MRYLISICCALLCSLAQAQFINVYVKYDDQVIKSKIDHYNQFLEGKGFFNKYQLRPFLENYPLHTSLYISEYQPNNEQLLIERAKKLAAESSSFSIKTTDLIISSGNYVMLDVALPVKACGCNHSLQQLSDKAVLALYGLHDRTAPIPDWAKKIPSKLAAFKRYGSPNVFFEFSPHFTLMATNFNTAEQSTAFQAEAKQLSDLFIKEQGAFNFSLTAVAIGVGYVNEFGQITKELVLFPLS